MTSHRPARATSHLRSTIARARRRRGAHARRRRGARDASPGDRMADAIAAVVGSWPFVLGQTALLAAWLIGNGLAGGRAWDPYPFILLNLLLSFQAAYAAPIIMMSQNRQEEIDRARAIADYRVNLRAEADITLLHEKIDLLREQELAAVTDMLRRALERLEMLEGRARADPDPS
jgi:uncharacterized membrane protein